MASSKPSRLEVTDEELGQLRRMQISPRGDWPAVFSTNGNGEVWPFVTYNWTPHADRRDVQGEARVLDLIARFYIDRRPEGGRFFIDDRGAFCSEPPDRKVQFVTFKLVESDPIRPALRPFPGIHNETPAQLAARLHREGRCEIERCHLCGEEGEAAKRAKENRALEAAADQILGVAGRRKKSWER